MARFTVSALDILGPGTILRGNAVAGRSLNAWFTIESIEIIEQTLEEEQRTVFLGVATSTSGRLKKLVNVDVFANAEGAGMDISAVYTGDE